MYVQMHVFLSFGVILSIVSQEHATHLATLTFAPWCTDPLPQYISSYPPPDIESTMRIYNTEYVEPKYV